MCRPIWELVPSLLLLNDLMAKTNSIVPESVPVRSTCSADPLEPVVGGVSVAQGPCRFRQVPLKLPRVPPQLLAREVAAMLHQVVLSHLVATVKVARVQLRKVLEKHTLLAVAVQVEKHPGTLMPEDFASSFASAETAAAVDPNSAVGSVQKFAAAEVLSKIGSEQRFAKSLIAQLTAVFD